MRLKAQNPFTNGRFQLMNSIQQPHIAVIGAGFAGACLTKLLIDAGIRVSLFEKSRGTGGRLSSCRLDNHSADLGAPFFTPRTLAFKRWLEQQPDITTWNPKVTDFSGKTLPSETFFIALPKQSSLTRRLIQGADFTPSTRIAKISHNTNKQDQKNSIYDDDGLLLGNFDGVIITAPAAQAEPLLNTTQISKLATAYSSIENQITPQASWVQVLVLKSSDRITPDLIQGEHKLLFKCIKNSSKPNRAEGSRNDIWVIEANKEWSELNKNSDPENVKKQLTEAFLKLLPIQPEILATRTHRWLYARHEAVDEEFIWDSETCIGACGDWLAPHNLEGAWHSAKMLAKTVIKKLYRAKFDARLNNLEPS